MKLQFSPTGTIASYERMNYEYAHALAEFIDNSTHSAKLNINRLRQTNPNYVLKVDITYEPNAGLQNRGYFEIQDNACGMTKAQLERALIIGKPPEIIGRSRYGMGMKTAAMWMGKRITIRTKALGETQEYEVILDLKKFSDGDFDLPFREIEKKDKNLSYTIIKVELLEQVPYGRAIGAIKKQLESIYRMDTRNGSLSLSWNGIKISWDDTDWTFIPSEDGSGEYKKDFEFEITRSDKTKKKVYGWVGVLLDGARTKSGFSALSCDRVIIGYPKAWKPESIFGDYESNNLINQRITGEIHFDDFDVTHTKDAFKWYLDEYTLICDKLEEICSGYMNKAITFQKRGGNKKQATNQQKQEALDDIKKEAESTQIKDAVATKGELIDPQLVDKATKAAVKKISSNSSPKITLTVSKDLTAKLYTHEGEITGCYLSIATHEQNVVSIIVNESHPAFPDSSDMEVLTSWYRMCLFDGIAEFWCELKQGKIFPNSVREYKDILYRARMNFREQE